MLGEAVAATELVEILHERSTLSLTRSSRRWDYLRISQMDLRCESDR